MKFLIVLILLETVLQPVVSYYVEKKEADTSSEDFEDAFLSTEELIRKYGYPVEVHTVETTDGYLLTVHRIPRKGAIPVYFFHGFLEDAASAVEMGTDKGLGYILYNEGYDVWLANARGTRYSKKHKYLQTHSDEYWDFSFHEFGIFDIPNTIDYILNTTRFERIQYIGYSQGTTAFWIMCSDRPEYREKIIMMNALAPVGAIPHTKSPVLVTLAPLTKYFNVGVTILLGRNEFLPNTWFVRIVALFACQDVAVTQKICSNILFLIAGYGSRQLNYTSLPVYFGHTPAGCGTKELIHYLQTVNSGEFRQYDYGFLGNLKKYGSISPPPYDLSKVTVPVVLHFAENDVISMPKDVLKLARNLPNVKGKLLVPDPMFNHIDFMHAIDVKSLVYDRVIQEMRRGEKAYK